MPLGPGMTQDRLPIRVLIVITSAKSLGHVTGSEHWQSLEFIIPRTTAGALVGTS